MNNKYKKSVINLVKASEDLDAMGYNSLSSKILRLAYRLHSHAQDLNPLSIPPAQPVYDPAEYTKTFQEMRTYITYAGMRLDEATKGTITMDESQLNARSDIKDLHSQVQSSINQETSDINVASGKIDNLFKLYTSIRPLVYKNIQYAATHGVKKNLDEGWGFLSAARSRLEMLKKYKPQQGEPQEEQEEAQPQNTATRQPVAQYQPISTGIQDALFKILVIDGLSLPGKIDGKLGPETRKALDTFKAHYMGGKGTDAQVMAKVQEMSKQERYQPAKSTGEPSSINDIMQGTAAYLDDNDNLYSYVQINYSQVNDQIGYVSGVLTQIYNQLGQSGTPEMRDAASKVLLRAPLDRNKNISVEDAQPRLDDLNNFFNTLVGPVDASKNPSLKSQLEQARTILYRATNSIRQGGSQAMKAGLPPISTGVQQALFNILVVDGFGLPGKIDGKLGPETRKAMDAFKARYMGGQGTDAQIMAKVQEMSQNERYQVGKQSQASDMVSNKMVTDLIWDRFGKLRK